MLFDERAFAAWGLAVTKSFDDIAFAISELPVPSPLYSLRNWKAAAFLLCLKNYYSSLSTVSRFHGVCIVSQVEEALTKGLLAIIRFFITTLTSRNWTRPLIAASTYWILRQHALKLSKINPLITNNFNLRINLRISFQSFRGFDAKDMFVDILD